MCIDCGYERPAYNSCRNRHCPKCQALAQEKWIEAQRARMLDVQHFHVVFTLPAELRALAAFSPRIVYDALHHAAADTLLEFGERRLSAKIGATLILHTWTRDLRLHPHVHPRPRRVPAPIRAARTSRGLSQDSPRRPARLSETARTRAHRARQHVRRSADTLVARATRDADRERRLYLPHVRWAAPPGRDPDPLRSSAAGDRRLMLRSSLALPPDRYRIGDPRCLAEPCLSLRVDSRTPPPRTKTASFTLSKSP